MIPTSRTTRAGRGLSEMLLGGGGEMHTSSSFELLQGPSSILMFVFKKWRMRDDSMSMPHWCQSVSIAYHEARHSPFKTYQAASNEKNCYGDVLEVLSCPLLPPVAEVFKEDVCSAVGKDQSAFHEFRCQMLGLART